jgi:ketosteroid isomerase-like protein
MHRPVTSRLGLALLCTAMACIARRPASVESQQAQVRAATRHYADLVLAMNHHAIAELFTPDGEIRADDQPPIHGREAIERHLQAFAAYKVLEESLTADAIEMSTGGAHVSGTYHQRVRLPTGEVVTVGGEYTADWVLTPSSGWHIKRMATTAAR